MFPNKHLWIVIVIVLFEVIFYVFCKMCMPYTDVPQHLGLRKVCLFYYFFSFLICYIGTGSYELYELYAIKKNYIHAAVDSYYFF